MNQSIQNFKIDIKNKASDEYISRQSALRDMLIDIRHAVKELDLDFDSAVKDSEEDYLYDTVFED